MVRERQLRRALRFARPVLETRFDAAGVERMLEAMRRAYAEVGPHVPVLRSRFNRMTLAIAVDVLALFRALRTELRADEASALVQPFVDGWMDGQFESPIARFGYAHRPTHLLYRKLWFSSVNRADEPDGQKFEFLPTEGTRFYGVDVVRCGITKFLTAMGAPELTPFICRGDLHIQRYLPKGIAFRRTQVIADGGERCDFRYVETTPGGAGGGPGMPRPGSG
ncbi:MAG: L-2-amino-thiazoline-4-carboxylic acid hydrolase [Myxococcaceae bacterium]|jgi:hypothetical protein|nr:L-2-amino-thiazoline-4-carboxylic acid hydrolase [Myxococcaceae bacterium]MCA3012246.1 L-2-amino-thiazoline-4-carboxylic acid hydrolase [Myxococcaceae bacterium]